MDFKKTEQRFKKIKAKLISGKISEAKFKTQLEKMMVQDEHGNWWMIGYETEQWYRHNGNDWEQADIPAASKLESQDEQKPLWKFGKREIILSLAGIGIYFILAFLLKDNDTISKYWFPSHTVSLFFGLVFGPAVGAVVGAGQYVVSVLFDSASLFSGISGISRNFFDYFSNIYFIAFAAEGAMMGLLRTMPTRRRPSLKNILHLELIIILANVISILMSQNLSLYISVMHPSLNYFMQNMGYPLFGEMLVVPIGYMIYLFFFNKKKTV